MTAIPVEATIVLDYNQGHALRLVAEGRVHLQQPGQIWVVDGSADHELAGSFVGLHMLGLIRCLPAAIELTAFGLDASAQLAEASQ